MAIRPLILPNEPEIEAIDSWSAVKTDEGRYLAYLASIVPSHLSIVEIGSFQGRSTCFLASGSKYGHRATVYAVDPWNLNLDGITGEHLYANFQQNIHKVGVNDLVFPLRAESSDIVKNWKKPIGLLHIDDGHEYEVVLEEYRDWFPYIVENGWIVFHDSTWPDVKKVIDECVQDSDQWRVEDIPATSHGLFVAQRTHSK
ncbi:class I SAM-dependent methyltransferase [Effusibacillus consociatus]|uniref:Class I SAM-dependent methyltransferase n=1 Tax=Effusibacillus consociatus TaxID=1117041 RepID=A0ABV9PW17_9BACL